MIDASVPSLLAVRFPSPKTAFEGWRRVSGSCVNGYLVSRKELMVHGQMTKPNNCCVSALVLSSQRSMMRVIALNAPDSSVIERRFRSRFATAPQQRAPQGGGREEGERAVTLCMELVHREGCAVAEEANEILT